ncbi:ribonuclease H-like domain-containing protein [Tanacetum coccineum]
MTMLTTTKAITFQPLYHLVSNNNAKFPDLKKDEYEVWAMKMEYWITNNDMNISKVIQNGNNLKRTRRDHDGRSIPDDHVANFHYMDDAMDIWNAAKARFGGNAKSKKIRKSMLKQEFSEFRISESEGLHKGSYDRKQRLLSQVNKAWQGCCEDINLMFLQELKILRLDIKYILLIPNVKSPSHSDLSQVLIDKLDLEEWISNGKWLYVVSQECVWKLLVAGLCDACEEGAAEVYSLIIGNGTNADAGEFALMGMTSESSTSGDSNSMSNDFVSCDNSDKSSEVNINDFASSDSSVKSSEPKAKDSTSCASSPSVSTYGEVTQSNPVVPQAVRLRSGKVSIPAARLNQVPAGRPTPVSTGRPKPVSTESKDVTYPILKDFISLVENQLTKKVKAIRCDNGTEFKNAKLIELCGEKGIKRDYSYYDLSLQQINMELLMRGKFEPS